MARDSLTVSLDIGHQSIGWAVLDRDSPEKELVKGAGVVLFEKESCQNKARASHRRTRRNIAARRNRIKRLKLAFAAKLGLSRESLGGNPHPFPWLLAAKSLAGKSTLSPLELWSVLRWYAHNRGYDGNAMWARDAADPDDTKREELARGLMAEYGTKTMAETICAYLEVDLETEAAPRLSKYFKGVGAAFPRNVVENEVRHILRLHRDSLAGCDDEFEQLLLDDWKSGQIPGLDLPDRYQKGLLFGQFVPRFDNRIIPTCRISGEKCPSKHCQEYYAYRAAMMLGNLRVVDGSRAMRPLNSDERIRVLDAMKDKGYLTKTELAKAVHDASGCDPANLASYFMTQEMEKALVLDPVRREISSQKLKKLWPMLPDASARKAAGMLFKGKRLDLRWLLDEVEAHADQETVEKYRKELDALYTRGTAKRKHVPSLDEFLKEPIRLGAKAEGRSPYSRTVMKRAFEEVMQGLDPRARGGCLYESPEVLERLASLSLSELTNNHLVRHRLLMLDRLVDAVVEEFAASDPSRIGVIVCEVVRDLKEYSGMSPKEVETALNTRLKHHRKVVEELTKGLAEAGLEHRINGSLIRKARIADDLNWTCPYTGEKYGPLDLVQGRMDLEHVVPRSLRPTDSLESLVITFREVNDWKGNRTAMQFIRDQQSNPVPGRPEKCILTEERYLALVDALPTKGLSGEDQRRRSARKALLQVETYNKRERDFLPGELTATSHLNKLAALRLKHRFREHGQPKIVHLPGSVTAAVRRSWNLMGCLDSICPEIIRNGERVEKQEIRNLTHLHHAVDAITQGLAATLIPADGAVWEAMSKRTLNPGEGALLRGSGMFGIDQNGKWRLDDLPEPVLEAARAALAERRVYQHIPASQSGLRVELNTWRLSPVTADESGKVRLRQQSPRDPKSQSRPNPKWKGDAMPPEKVLGAKPGGKLARIKGGLVVPENYGVTLTPQPVVVPFINVHRTLDRIAREQEVKKPVPVLRNGMIIDVPRGRYAGRWRVRSIKAAANRGIVADFCRADLAKLPSKGKDIFINVRLKTLLRDGLAVQKTRFTGR